MGAAAARCRGRERRRPPAREPWCRAGWSWPLVRCRPPSGTAQGVVLTGGVVAAVAGPVIANWSKDLLPSVTYAGSYLVVTVFGMLSLALLALTDVQYVYAALACLGVGWNFMFVGGSTLLAHSYRPGEQAKAQAVSELTTFVSSAFGSLFAGQVLARYGWGAVNVAILPPLALAALATMWFGLSERRARR
ncbi:MFS transporter [Sorangium sp. So ce385]